MTRTPTAQRLRLAAVAVLPSLLTPATAPATDPRGFEFDGGPGKPSAPT